MGGLCFVVDDKMCLGVMGDALMRRIRSRRDARGSVMDSILGRHRRNGDLHGFDKFGQSNRSCPASRIKA